MISVRRPNETISWSKAARWGIHGGGAGHPAADSGRGQECAAGCRLREPVDAGYRGSCGCAAEPDSLPLRIEAELDARGPGPGEPAAARTAGCNVRVQLAAVETVAAGL